jgi:hypothetical protein
VGLHEFGHWLYLSDLYDPADAAKVMYGYSGSGTTKRALTADDIAGIQSIYGTSLMVTNSTGASAITATSARLNGEVTSTSGENPTVHVYWGTSDGGTTPGSWANDVNLGTTGTGTFYSDISSLTNGTKYYYRCYATNSNGSDWADSTASFTAGEIKFIGAASDINDNGYHIANMICLTRFQAEATGTVTEIRIKAGASGNVKVAIYGDSSGNPDTLINSTGSSAVSAGWNTISITPTAITEGTYYWLGVKTSVINAARYNNQSGTMWYKTSIPFANAWPDPAGTGYSSGAYHTALAGWGTTTPTTPPNPPNPISPGAAIILKWGAPNGATKYQLQVSTISSFTTTVFDADVGNNTSQEVTGLSFGTIYYWRVRAGNNGGWSNWSTTISFTVNQVP